MYPLRVRNKFYPQIFIDADFFVIPSWTPVQHVDHGLVHNNFFFRETSTQ